MAGLSPPGTVAGKHLIPMSLPTHSRHACQIPSSTCAPACHSDPTHFRTMEAKAQKGQSPLSVPEKAYSCPPTALEQILQSTAGKYCVGDEVSAPRPAHSGLLPLPLRLSHPSTPGLAQQGQEGGGAMERSRERGGPPCAKQRGPWGAPLLIPSQLPQQEGSLIPAGIHAEDLMSEIRRWSRQQMRD